MSSSDKWWAYSVADKRWYLDSSNPNQVLITQLPKAKKPPPRENRTFYDVENELSPNVTNEQNEGNYNQWAEKRVTGLNKDNIGKPYVISVIDDLNNYNRYATIQKSLLANGEKYALSYMFTAEGLNQFDNSYRVALMRYSQERLFNNKKIHESTFSRIWTRREYKERQKYIRSLKPMHVAIWRSGVIPFYFSGGDIYFGFAHDTTYIEESGGNLTNYNLSDFGGGVEIGESASMGAIREWSEESLNLFPRYSIPPDSIVSVYHGVAIYFVDITKDKPDGINLGRKHNQFPGNISISLENTLHEKLEEWKEERKMPNDFPEVGGVRKSVV